MRKVYLPWRYALTGIVAMSLLAPVSLYALPASSEVPAQQSASDTRTVTGTVYDSQDNEPLVGATVQLEGDKSKVAVTDIDGKFSITVKGKKAVLTVSYIGYKTKRVPVEDLGYLDIPMTGDNNTLDEVVVVGAGTQKKVSVTGAITSVAGDALKMPSSTLSTTLAGRVSGIIAQQKSGEPGTGAEFYIRGISTFGGKTTPLILLDEVEISAADLDFVPAENIESFSLLKDASATAIYGARGANGVMIVKTKGGDYNAKTSINVKLENSFNFVDRFPEFVDGATFMELRNKAMQARNPGIAPRYSQEAIDATRSGVNPILYPDVDWRGTLFRNMAMRQKASVGVSGGGSKVKYYMSLEMMHEDGLLNTHKLYSWNNNIQIYNYTFQNNISYKLTPSTTVSMNMNAQIRQNTGPNATSASIFNRILTTPNNSFPIMLPAVEGVEHVMYGSQEISAGYTVDNPYAVMNTTFKQQNQNTINTVIRIDQNLDMVTKGLSLGAWVNFKNWSSTAFARSLNPYYYAVSPADNELGYTTRLINTNGTDFIATSDISRSSDNTFEMQAFVNYARRFGNNNVTGMALYRMREYRNQVLPNRNQGFSGRITYDWASKYFAEFNFGYNGTERLAKKDRFGFFPAGSLGWVISSENFWEPISPVINFMKIRGSYGIVGSDDLAQPAGSYFLYIDKITDNNLNYLSWSSGPGYGYYQAAAGPQLVYYAMNGIGWEKVRKLDVGVDMQFFNNKFQLTADYFNESRYDIFLHREAWPQSLAYHEAKPWSNVGKMYNRGVDGQIKWQQQIAREWNIDVNGSITYSFNKITDRDIPPYDEAWVPNNETGLPLSQSRIDGYICEGLFKSQEEIDNSPRQDLGSTVMVGDLKYRDLNGDGIINSSDKTMISKYGRTPRLVYGFGAWVGWRAWDLGFQFTGSGCRSILANGVDPFMQGITKLDNNVLTWVADNYFDQDNPNFDAKYPRLGVANTDVDNNTQASTFWLRDGSFLRLRNVELGWSFKYGRIYVQGANLVTFSSFKLWDPELSSWNSYPMQKTVTVGVNLHI